MADPTGFEPAISSVTGWHVGPLHHGSKPREDSTPRHRLSPEAQVWRLPGRRAGAVEIGGWLAAGSAASPAAGPPGPLPRAPGAAGLRRAPEPPGAPDRFLATCSRRCRSSGLGACRIPGSRSARGPHGLTLCHRRPWVAPGTNVATNATQPGRWQEVGRRRGARVPGRGRQAHGRRGRRDQGLQGTQPAHGTPRHSLRPILGHDARDRPSKRYCHAPHYRHASRNGRGRGGRRRLR
jgi:hypothetical protein